MSLDDPRVPLAVLSRVVGAGRSRSGARSHSWLSVAVFLVAFLVAGLALGHVHGEATLRIVAEEREAVLELEVSAEVVLGRERPPRDDAEREEEAAALVALEARLGAIVEAPPHCAFSQVEVRVERRGHHAAVRLSARLECETETTLAGQRLTIDPAAIGRLERTKVELLGASGGQSRVIRSRWTSDAL